MIVAAGVVTLFLIGSVTHGEDPAELQPFAFLVGEWAASGSGQPGSAVGAAVFDWGLQGRIILRTSYAEYPPGGGKPGSRHDDLMVIYVSPVGAKADYYDSEGHVIRYNVSSPAPDEAVFLSQPAAGEPTFRLSYKLASADSLDGEFAIAAPGTQQAFKPYLSWQSHKVIKPEE